MEQDKVLSTYQLKVPPRASVGNSILHQALCPELGPADFLCVILPYHTPSYPPYA